MAPGHHIRDDLPGKEANIETQIETDANNFVSAFRPSCTWIPSYAMQLSEPINLFVFKSVDGVSAPCILKSPD